MGEVWLELREGHPECEKCKILFPEGECYVMETYAAFPLHGYGLILTRLYSTRHFWSMYPFQHSATFRVPGRDSNAAHNFCSIDFSVTPLADGEVKGWGVGETTTTTRTTTQYMYIMDSIEGMVFSMTLRQVQC